MEISGSSVVNFLYIATDYTPGISSIKSLTYLFISCCCKQNPMTSPPMVFGRITLTSFQRYLILFVPVIGNVVIIIFDLYAKLKLSSVSSSQLEEETKEKGSKNERI